jgi:hypothetical protein
MYMNSVPEPFLFNPLKHHAGYISGFIREIIACGECGTEKLKGELVLIGKSQTDLYTGKEGLPGITRQIREFLEKDGLTGENPYMTWLGAEKPGYRRMTLRDGSEWILLPGKTPGRWVHIHPARYSRFSLRVRAETLKTAIAVIYHCSKYGLDHFDLEVVNQVRTGLLNQSPMKELSPHRGTGKIINIIAEASPE